MEYVMKRLSVLPVMGLILVAAVTSMVIADEPEKAANPELIAVKFHADWCGSCKTMGNTFIDLESKLDSQPVLFVELDQTTSAKARQAGYLMDVVGGGAIWEEYGGKTGFILLIDPSDMSIAGKLTKDMGFKDMVKAIDAARQP